MHPRASRVILIAAVATFALAAAAGIWAGETQPPVRKKPAPAPVSLDAVAQTPAADRDKPIVGFAISFHHTDDVKPFLKTLNELADLGVTRVELVTPAFQTDGAAEEVRLIEGRSAKGEHLLAVMNHAHRRGMRVHLMPIVLFTDPRGNEWRGKISPENWGRWWDSYRKTLDHFVAIAKEGNADALAVGSELLSTERQTERWTSLIAHVRARFAGKLYYSTNWDHYTVPGYWKQLDTIGISCYWDMTTKAKDTAHPTLAELLERWKEIRGEVLAFARSQDRPILLTELGYPSLPWGLKDPWNYVAESAQESDPGQQALGYESFLKSWSDLLRAPRVSAEQPFAGVFFYSWQPWDTGDKHDIGYGIKGKPALAIVKQWLGQTPANSAPK